MATQRYRRNAVSNLKLEDGSTINDHQQMAGKFLEAFKQRMGCTVGVEMGFNLETLIRPVEGLHSLSSPFTTEEMDSVVKYMPHDRAPGPDGFSGQFLKKCWDIVSADFYKLAADFHDGKT